MKSPVQCVLGYGANLSGQDLPGADRWDSALLSIRISASNLSVL
jgi:hypothetical protein